MLRCHWSPAFQYQVLAALCPTPQFPDLAELPCCPWSVTVCFTGGLWWSPSHKLIVNRRSTQVYLCAPLLGARSSFQGRQLRLWDPPMSVQAVSRALCLAEGALQAAESGGGGEELGSPSQNQGL